MGFILYKKEVGSKSATFTRVRKLSLIGGEGAMTEWLRAQTDAELPMKWQLGGADLLKAMAPDLDPATHVVVLDMMPGRMAGVSLCEVAMFAGYSDSDETDMVVSMREISGMEAILPAGESFTAPLKQDEPGLIESLGITGGTKGGSYRWCAPKMNIGAAVCSPK